MAQFRDLIVTGPSRFLGNVFLSGSLEIGSSLSVLGDIEGAGDLTISGNGEFLDGLRVYTPNSGDVLAEFTEDDTGRLLINLGVGNANIELHGESFILDANTNNITGETNITGTTNIIGTLSTSNRITVSSGGIGVVGDSAINGANIALTGTTKIDITGTTTNITGVTNINGATNITGATGITGTLTSSGLITGSNGLVVNGAESTFNKSVTINGNSSNLIVGGTLSVTGMSNLKGGITFDEAADKIVWAGNAGIVAGTTTLILAPNTSPTTATGLSLTTNDIKWKDSSLLTVGNYSSTLDSKYIKKNTTDTTTGKVNFNGGIGFSDNKGTITWDATAQAIVVSFS